MSSPDREEETKQREEEAEEEMAVFNQMRIIAPISPKVGVRPRVINSDGCDGAQQLLCIPAYPTHQFNYES